MALKKKHKLEEPRGAYANSMEHLHDELERLNLLIEAVAHRRTGAPSADPLDQLRGLVVTEKEIQELLPGRGGASAGRNGEGTIPDDLAAALASLETRMENRRQASVHQAILLALPHLAQLFGLDRFEEECLVICLAPELDRKYDKLYAYVQDDVTRKRPTIGLVLDLLCRSPEQKLLARASFGALSPLRRFRLVQVVDQSPDAPSPLIGRSLKLDDCIADLLLGCGQIDARLESSCTVSRPTEVPAGANAPPEVQQKVQQFVRVYFGDVQSPQRSVVFHVHGPYGSGKRALAEAAARELQLPLIVADADRLLATASPVDTLWFLARESCLRPAVLCLENFDLLLAPESGRDVQLKAFLEALEQFSQLSFLCGSEVWRPQGRLSRSRFISLKTDVPDHATRFLHWQSQVPSGNGVDEVDLGELAAKFRFTPGQIRDALATARDASRWSLAEADEITAESLHSACRAQSNPKLVRLARKIEPRYDWDDIVLPPDPRAQLREICNQARYRRIVFGEWGFEQRLSLGKGLAALFSGPPGTGKSMAAEVIAAELGLDLYKIDLAQIVSKYIGETEKNLERVFAAAENGCAILFFDEADALFGKRSEVHDSHDRYANVEISYLLQRMEEYEGISILATNLRKNIDDAFLRRLQFIVQFSFPDAQYRERIWRVLFPKQAPVAEDVDFTFLAREIKMAGGCIKNIGLAAAFYAAGDGGVIHMPHLLQAAVREHQKLGREWRHADKVEGAIA